MDLCDAPGIAHLPRVPSYLWLLTWTANSPYPDASQDLGTKANQTQLLLLDSSGVLNIFLASEAALCVSDSQVFPVNVSFGSLLLLKIALVPISYA